MGYPSQLDPRERNVVLALKKERETQGISAARLARQIGVGRNTIPNLERDEARPTLWVLLKIADGLGVRFDEVMKGANRLSAAGPPSMPPSASK
jgi:transcriptional regulator with XRE-family HTH domain